MYSFEIHIGRKIKEQLDKSAFTVTDFARYLNLSRSGAYKLFSNKHIDALRLHAICRLLNHNFFDYYPPADNDRRASVPQLQYATRDDVEALMNSLRHLSDRI